MVLVKKLVEYFSYYFSYIFFSGGRFSITFDEWTSKSNRRYLCLNLHSTDKVYGLGTVRIQGSLPAEAAAASVASKLQEFGLNLTKDIVGATTDGASVMKKTGRIMEVEHQLCHCHGLHLAVTGVLYKKCTAKEEEEEDEEEDDLDPGEGEEEEEEDDEEEEFVEDYTKAIKKVRTIVRLFRKSPVSNDLLLQNCQQEYGKQLGLVRDIRTRWNSLLKSIKRFLEIKTAVGKTLIDLNKMDLFPEKDEVDVLEHLAEALDLVETASLALSRRDSTLNKADIIFEFLLKNLEEQDTAASRQLFSAVRERILERRKKDLSCLLAFLDDPRSFSEKKSAHLPSPSTTALARTAQDLYRRYIYPKQ